MAVKTDLTEKRKYKRFKAKEGAFALLASDNKLGQIKNISRGGLTFQYIGADTPSKGSTEIEIFSPALDFYLKKVPIKSIEDAEIESDVPFSSIPTKQLSVQFGEMTSMQLTLLNHFIEKYTDK